MKNSNKQHLQYFMGSTYMLGGPTSTTYYTCYLNFYDMVSKIKLRYFFGGGRGFNNFDSNCKAEGRSAHQPTSLYCTGPVFDRP